MVMIGPTALEGEAPTEAPKPDTAKLDLYDALAEEALKGAKTGPSDEDVDAITSRIVEKLKAQSEWKEGDSEETLFAQARRIYWDWKDAKRKAEKSGKDEYLDTAPMGVC